LSATSPALSFSSSPSTGGLLSAGGPSSGRAGDTGLVFGGASGFAPAPGGFNRGDAGFASPDSGAPGFSCTVGLPVVLGRAGAVGGVRLREFDLDLDAASLPLGTGRCTVGRFTLRLPDGSGLREFERDGVAASPPAAAPAWSDCCTSSEGGLCRKGTFRKRRDSA